MLDTTIWESFGLHEIQVTLLAFAHFHQLRDELINPHPKIWGNIACLLFAYFQHHQESCDLDVPHSLLLKQSVMPLRDSCWWYSEAGSKCWDAVAGMETMGWSPAGVSKCWCPHTERSPCGNTELSPVPASLGCMPLHANTSMEEVSTAAPYAKPSCG